MISYKILIITNKVINIYKLTKLKMDNKIFMAAVADEGARIARLYEL